MAQILEQHQLNIEKIFSILEYGTRLVELFSDWCNSKTTLLLRMCQIMLSSFDKMVEISPSWNVNA